ncbi:MAG: hypothetical protein ACK58L_12520 [Planctomycetota bacterium]
MAKEKQSGITYREHQIKEDHSFSQGFGRTGVQKRYACKVNGRTIKGSLEEIRAKIDHHLDSKSGDGRS